MAGIEEPLLEVRSSPLFIVERYSYSHVCRNRVSGFIQILAVAVLLSYFIPVGCSLPNPWDKVSSLVGWAYFLCWTVSFYPQFLHNMRRKSVEGLSLDYLVMNILGFACYSVFNLALMFNKQVKAEFQSRFGKGVPVEWNDTLFSLHALVMSLATGLQCLFFRRAADQQVHTGTWLAVGLLSAAGGTAAVRVRVYGEGAAPWTWLDLCYYCSVIKMMVTVVKFVPQVILNYTLQSTAGWSLDNVLLDVGGGLLSMVQLFMTCICLGNWSLIVGNPIKLGLGLISLGFDFIFIMQHAIYQGRPTITPMYCNAAWFGELKAGIGGCGTAGCRCPCPRCQFQLPGHGGASSDFAAAVVASGAARSIGAVLSASQLQAAARSVACLCVHGAADGYTPLASQFYRGANRGSASNLYSVLPEGVDFVI